MRKIGELFVTDTDCALPPGFWSAVDVWIKKPHVVNKRLCGVKEEGGKEVTASQLTHTLSTLWGTAAGELNDIFLYLYDDDDQSLADCHLHDGVLYYDVRTIIPKINCYGTQLHKEIVLKDFSRHRVTFLPFQESEEGSCVFRKSNVYQVRLSAADEKWALCVWALQPSHWFSDGVAYPQLSWLGHELLPRLARWATDLRSSEFPSTLSLLPVEKYGPLYQELKAKYRKMVQVWPEVTDPEKFVYEDVAIATYLLVLWEQERAEKGLTSKQSFVDIGCGNGLLVHILSNEGHPGKGLDIRRRKIWDMYGSQTHLEETTIIPSDHFLFPDTDWLIGNHSDELTPWIPVMSSRSSSSCRFFVLPCCFFDFTGKFQRRRCKVSQYREYIDFISEIGTVCGFHVEEDCLRIPSTKRVCVIGKARSYDAGSEHQVKVLRAQFISARSGGPESDQTVGVTWGQGFQPRQKVEVVRNCARLPRDLVERVVLQVAMALLASTSPEDGKDSTWNRGGSLTLRQVAELLERDTLQTLKKECGGLQTLLKNNHQVFKVESGAVSLRDWRVPAELPRHRLRPRDTDARKTRTCWFYSHHPQSCPLESNSCPFAHGEAELRAASAPCWRQREK